MTAIRRGAAQPTRLLSFTSYAVMAASLGAGETTVGNAAVRAARPGSPPLPRLARGEDGGRRVRTSCESARSRPRGGSWTIGLDHVEVSSFIGLAAVTGGDLTIEGSRPEDRSRSCRRSCGWCGWRSATGRFVFRGQELDIEDDIGGHIPKIEDGPCPRSVGLTSIALTVATQARNGVLFEKMFENRLFFMDKLFSMGACIIVIRRGRELLRADEADAASGWRARTPRGDVDAAREPLCGGRVDDRGDLRDRQGLSAHDERLRGLGARIERVAT